MSLPTVGPTEPLPVPVLAGIIARLQLNFDPRRLDETQAQVLLATWLEHLEGVHPLDAETACGVFLRDENRHGPQGFPSVGEFRAEAIHQARKRMNQIYEREGAAAAKCPTCLGSKLVWTARGVTEELDDEGNVLRMAALYEFVSPCPQCDAEERAYWAAGHYHRDHNIRTCSHPRCEKRAEGTRRY